MPVLATSRAAPVDERKPSPPRQRLAISRDGKAELLVVDPLAGPPAGGSSAVYFRYVSSRARVWAFGSAGVLVLAGGMCAALVHGLIGQLLTIVLLSVGLGGAVLLLFLEVGLSEDRDRAQDEKRRQKRSSQRIVAVPKSRSGPSRWPRRPS